MASPYSAETPAKPTENRKDHHHVQSNTADGLPSATRLSTAAAGTEEEARRLEGDLIVVGIFVALIVLMGACVAAIGGDDTAAPPPPSEESTASEPKSEGSQPPAEKTYKIGDKATDDDYQFTVTKIKCGVSRVGDTYSNEKAQGQFCLVSLRIKNVGNDPISYSSENQALVDTKGKNYSPDDEAWIYADDSDVWGEINPGNTLKTIVPFDVPKKTKPDHLLLKAGVWGASDGVIVKV